MFKKYILMVTAAILLCIGGCGPSHYFTVKTNGQNYKALAEPQYIQETDSYTFQNLDGEKIILPKKDVQKIEEVR